MAKNNIININLFGREIGRIGFDENKGISFFQYNPEFLKTDELMNIFPDTGIIKRIPHIQNFSQFNNETFKSLPPQFADSLPDMFGSIIFKAWLESKDENEISILEQLAYVSNRGMGAIEYAPSKKIPKSSTINLKEIVEVLKDVLDLKKSSQEKHLSSQALINIFKIGTSAGGARAKILVSVHIESGQLIPGDINYSKDYNHYLIKLAMGEDSGYPREIVEYCYYLTLRKVGIKIMDSKLIDGQHFATMRFDRQGGEKQHVLTATGLTGWDYKDSKNSSYENLFKLCSFLKLSQAEIEDLYKRMIFNVVFGNTDDHMKNHSFIYNRNTDEWSMSPAYDITYALNPLLQITRVHRALSINNKRSGIELEDVMILADEFTIKNPRGVIEEVQSVIPDLMEFMCEYNVPTAVIEGIEKKIVCLI